MAILSNGKFYGFLCSAKETGQKLANGVKEYVEDFVSGFAGHGWKIWEYVSGKWMLEVDALRVRGQFTVFELLVSKIRAIIGAQAITQGCGKIKTVTVSDDGIAYLITIEDADMSFVEHDFIRCQEFSGGQKLYHVEIESVTEGVIRILKSEFDVDGEGVVMNPPAPGDDIVQFGNSSHDEKYIGRHSAIYMHADEGAQPAIDVLDGIYSKDWSDCLKVRMGGDIPGSNGLKGFYCVNGIIKGIDNGGSVLYQFNPDGSGFIGRGAIKWDAEGFRFGTGVKLAWDNLDDETKENLKGEPGQDGKDGLDGVNGENGKDGLDIVWKGELSTSPANPQKNWVYRNTIDGRVYIYNGILWTLMVADGNDGTEGANGKDGKDVYITYHDSEEEPARPNGNGTTGGWHTNATATVIWISQKVAEDAETGEWGDPIKVKGNQGEPGKDANLLSWIEEWNSNKTEIGGEFVVSPKIFSGTKDSDGKLTGIALGRDCVTINGEKRTGIFALDEDNIIFELDPLIRKYKFSGTILVRNEKGDVWEVTSNGDNIIGNKTGKRVVISPNSSDIKIYDDSNTNVASIEGVTRNSIPELFGGVSLPSITIINVPFSITKTSQKKVISNSFHTVGLTTIDLSCTASMGSMYKTSTELTIEVESYSDAALKNYVGRTILLNDGHTDTNSWNLSLQNVRMTLNEGYHVLSTSLSVAQQNLPNFLMKLETVNASLLSNGYISTYFANGLAFGTSSDNLFAFMNSDGHINGKIMSHGSGIEITSDLLKVRASKYNGFVPAMICHGRAYSTLSNAYIVRCRSYDGNIPTIARRSVGSGWLRMTIPASWTADGFSSNTVQVLLTGFGVSVGSTQSLPDGSIKASVLSVSSTYIDIILSDDASANDGEFYFEMKWF